MKSKFGIWVSNEIKALFKFSKNDKPWHGSFLAAACAAFPLFIGYYTNHLGPGLLACTGGLVILYLPPGKLIYKMITLLACSFGFVLSFAIGLFFNSNEFYSLITLVIFSFITKFIINYFNVRPPGSYLFIMIAAIAIFMPHQPDGILSKVILLGTGSLLACLLAFFYLLIFLKRQKINTEILQERKGINQNLTESLVLALFVGLSLLIADFLNLQKPYWIPISCAAVMHGNDVRHIWQRSFQRITGTLAGLGIAWLLLSIHFNMLGICIAITLFQFLAFIFSSRHYALVVVFFTPVAIFLAEAGSAMQSDPDQLMKARLFDTLIGCAIGAIGGWFLHLQLRRIKSRG